MRATGIAAPPAVTCRADGSEQQRVARAFVAAAIRLGALLPTERDALPPPYRGRHRRSITARLDAPCQAAQP